MPMEGDSGARGPVVNRCLLKTGSYGVSCIWQVLVRAYHMAREAFG